MSKIENTKSVAFINREKELGFLNNYLSEEPESILFIYGPKSSGKTTVLLKLIDSLKDKKNVDVRFLNLRTILICNYDDFLRTMFKTETLVETKEGVKRHYNLFGLFKLDAVSEKSLKEKREDPFLLLQKELEKLNDDGIRPVIIIDELQALQNIYVNGQRQLIKELFNFFVSMTKEFHLAHVVISSSDGYFVETVYEDSRLRKTSKFYKIDYLTRDDVYEWLSDLFKHSKIKNLVLSTDQIEEIWGFLGGSCWEIQSLLSEIMYSGFTKAVADYRVEKVSEVINCLDKDYERKKVLKLFINNNFLKKELIFNLAGIEFEVLNEMLSYLVGENILFFNPVTSNFSPQSKSVEYGIMKYFENELR